MKSAIFWDVMPYSPLKVYLPPAFHPGVLLGIFFFPEDGGDMFFRKVG
jgi:hypothetical protein